MFPLPTTTFIVFFLKLKTQAVLPSFTGKVRQHFNYIGCPLLHFFLILQYPFHDEATRTIATYVLLLKQIIVMVDVFLLGLKVLNLKDD